MKCPKCDAPLHPLQRRCNRCAVRVGFCNKCRIVSLLSEQKCKLCQKPFSMSKSFLQLENEYDQKRLNTLQAIRFRCICSKIISVAGTQAGKVGKCPKCGYRLVVPDPATLKSSSKSALKPFKDEPKKEKEKIVVKNKSPKTFSQDIFAITPPPLSAVAPANFSEDLFDFEEVDQLEEAGEFVLPMNEHKKTQPLKKPKLSIRPPESTEK